VRRPIVLADVGLELDDPPDPAVAARVVSDQPSSQQESGRLERRQGDERGDLVQETET
jgi:hypothetical protein